MASQIKQRLDDPDVTFVDGDVQRRLPPLVSRVQIGAGRSQQFHDGRLVAERRVVDGAVAVGVLDLDVGTAAKQHANHLKKYRLIGTSYLQNKNNFHIQRFLPISGCPFLAMFFPYLYLFKNDQEMPIHV